MKKRFIGLAAVYMLVPVILLAQPAGKKQLVGVWAVKEAPVGLSQSPLLSLAMYGSDGSFTTAGGYQVLPPIPAVQEVADELGPGYGRWAATDDRAVRLTFYSILWKEGLGNGYQRVQDTLVLSESGDEYTGHAQVDFLDANWNVVFSTTSDIKGTRLETPAMLIAQPPEKKQLVGVWAKKIKANGSERPILTIDTFRADGSFTNISNKRLGYGKTLGTVSFRAGRWVATGAGEFQLKFYSVICNQEGLVDLLGRVQTTMTLSESGDEFTEHGQWEYFDLNWTVAFRGTSDVKATRLETPDED
jgi:hypothetical protein